MYPELETPLRALIERGRRRELVIACLSLSSQARAYVDGIGVPEAALATWLAGKPVDLAAATTIAEALMAREYQHYAELVTMSHVDYGSAGRAALVHAACKVAGGGPLPSAESLAHDALSAMARGYVTEMDRERAARVVRSLV